MVETSIENSLNEIYAIYEKGNFEEAIRLCNKEILRETSEEKKSLLSYYKGLIYEDKCAYEKAIESYEKALRYKKDAIDPLIREYEIYRYLNQLNSLLEVINRIIEVRPDDFLGYDLKFNLLYSLRLYKESEEIIKLIEENFDEDKIIDFMKVKLYVSTCRYSEALKIINIEDKNSNMYYPMLREKAKIELLTDNIDKGIEILKEIYNFNSEDLETIYLLGSMYMMKGKLEEANEYFENILSLKSSTEYPYLLGLYYYGVTLKYKSLSLANEYFKGLLRKYNGMSMRNPNDINILLLRSMLLYELERDKECLELITYIEDISSNIYSTVFIKSLVYRRKKDEENYNMNKEELKVKDEFLYKMLVGIEEVSNK